jgi:hypothetical protein
MTDPLAIMRSERGRQREHRYDRVHDDTRRDSDKPEHRPPVSTHTGNPRSHRGPAGLPRPAMPPISTSCWHNLGVETAFTPTSKAGNRSA